MKQPAINAGSWTHQKVPVAFYHKDAAWNNRGIIVAAKQRTPSKQKERRQLHLLTHPAPTQPLHQHPHLLGITHLQTRTVCQLAAKKTPQQFEHQAHAAEQRWAGREKRHSSRAEETQKIHADSHIYTIFHTHPPYLFYSLCPQLVRLFQSRWLYRFVLVN